MNQEQANDHARGGYSQLALGQEHEMRRLRREAELRHEGFVEGLDGLWRKPSPIPPIPIPRCEVCERPADGEWAFFGDVQVPRCLDCTPGPPTGLRKTERTWWLRPIYWLASL